MGEGILIFLCLLWLGLFVSSCLMYPKLQKFIKENEGQIENLKKEKIREIKKSITDREKELYNLLAPNCKNIEKIRESYEELIFEVAKEFYSSEKKIQVIDEFAIKLEKIRIWDDHEGHNNSWIYLALSLFHDLKFVDTDNNDKETFDALYDIATLVHCLYNNTTENRELATKVKNTLEEIKNFFQEQNIIVKMFSKGDIATEDCRLCTTKFIYEDNFYNDKVKNIYSFYTLLPDKTIRFALYEKE